MSINEVFDQISTAQDVRKSLDNIASTYSKRYKDIVMHTYTSDEIRSLYNAMRETNEINDKVNARSTIKQILKIPNAYVLHFLNDMFAPKYGDDWLKDQKTLWKVIKKEDLIKPWLTIKLKLRSKQNEGLNT